MPSRKTHATGASWAGIGAGLLGRVTSAFAPKVERRQTEIMKKTGAVRISAAELRARVNDLADHLAGHLEQAADRIAREAPDPAVRRHANSFKVDAVPTVYTAAYRGDPLAAALDAWGLAFQLRDYFATGAGHDAFGAQQPMIQKETSRLLADVDVFVRTVTTSPGRFDGARGKVERWAKEHRIEHAFASRASVAPVLTEWRSEDRDAFRAVGDVTDTLEALSERLNTYAAQLPRQVRWQAELLLEETVENEVPGLLRAAGATAREILTAERLAVLSALHDEGTAILAALRQERIATITDVDAIQARAVDTATERLRGLVDYTLWRVAAMLAILLLAVATVALIVHLLAAGAP